MLQRFDPPEIEAIEEGKNSLLQSTFDGSSRSCLSTSRGLSFSRVRAWNILFELPVKNGYAI